MMNILQKTWIAEWCFEKEFNFTDCDVARKKLPCALDKNYKEDNQTFFIKGFSEGSKRVGVSYGGLKALMTLKMPINEFPRDAVMKEFLPKNYICARCNKKNLNLRTDDGHKTYVCPNCILKTN